MSETKKKPTGEKLNGTKGGGKPGKFREKLNHIFKLMKEIDTSQEGIDEYDQVLEERDSLNKALSAKETQHEKTRNEKAAAVSKLEAQLQDARNEKAVMWKEFHSQLEDLKSKAGREVQLQADVAQLKGEKQTFEAQANAANVELEKLKNGFEKSRADLKKKSGQLVSSELDCTKLRSELALQESSLAITRRQLGEGRLIDLDVDQMSADFETLANRCHGLAVQFFRNTEDLGAIEPGLAERLIGKNTQLLPLSASRSPAARLARCAAAEAVIARVIADEIFVDLYFPSENTQAGVATVLDLLRKGDLEREKIVRSQLLAAHEELITDENVHEQVLERAVRQCYNPLSSLFRDPGRGVNFCEGLRAIFDDAIGLWQPLQANADRAVSSAEPEGTWILNKEFDAIPHSGDVGRDLIGSTDRPILPLFPQVSVEEKIIFPGVALFPNQRTVIVARIEEEKAEAERNQTAGSAGNGIMRGLRGRSHSIALPPRSLSSISGSAIAASSSSRDSQGQMNGAGGRTHLQKTSSRVGSARTQPGEPGK